MYGEVIAVPSNKEYTISWEDQSKPDSNHYQASKFNCICRATDDEGREDDPALLSDEELWYPGCGACLKRRWHRDLIPDGLDPTSSSSGRKRLSRACCFQTQVRNVREENWACLHRLLCYARLLSGAWKKRKAVRLRRKAP